MSSRTSFQAVKVESDRPDTIADTKVLKTYLDGRLIYTAPENGTSRMQRCD